jgi:hypothetical protein
MLAPSIQFKNTDTNDHDATVWFRKNGTDIANSATITSIPKAADGGAGLLPGAAAIPNTGGGGGGGSDLSGPSDTGQSGGDGGSGVIILKYPSNYSITSSGTLVSNTDSTTVSGFKITTFVTGNGSISFS